MQDRRARRVRVHVFGDIQGNPVDEEVAKLVAAGHSVVVHHARAGDPPLLRIVREHEQAVLWCFVDGVGDGILLVAHDDSRALRVERGNTSPKTLYSLAGKQSGGEESTCLVLSLSQ